MGRVGIEGGMTPTNQHGGSHGVAGCCEAWIDIEMPRGDLSNGIGCVTIAGCLSVGGYWG